MQLLAIDTFFQGLFGALIAMSVIIFWVVAVMDVFRHRFTGVKIAAVLVLILMFPVVGPVLYFVFVSPRDHATPEEAYMADADIRREAARRPIGGTGTYS